MLVKSLTKWLDFKNAELTKHLNRLYTDNSTFIFYNSYTRGLPEIFYYSIL